MMEEMVMTEYLSDDYDSDAGGENGLKYLYSDSDLIWWEGIVLKSIFV